MSKSRRYQVLTDESVQGELLFRTLIYWCCSLLVIVISIVGWTYMTGPTRSIAALGLDAIYMSVPVILGSLLLLPFVIIDVLRVSNRIVAPVQQIRFTLRQLAHKEISRRVCLRRNDFWHELAEYTNMVVDDVEQTREAISAVNREKDRDEADEATDQANVDFKFTDELVETASN